MIGTRRAERYRLSAKKKNEIETFPNHILQLELRTIYGIDT